MKNLFDVHEIQINILFFQAFQRLASLFQQMPRESPDFDVFKAKSIQWTSSQENPSGHPRLRQLLAYNLWSSKRFVP